MLTKLRRCTFLNSGHTNPICLNITAFICYRFQVNGSITLNENLADNGGVRESYRAMQIALKRINGTIAQDSKFTLDQQFFLGFGTVSINI